MRSAKIIKAASAAFLFAMMAMPGTAQAQSENERALLVAAERGELVVVRQLVARGGVNINARDMRGRTALLLATHRNEVEVARVLIQEGADVNAKDHIQDSPFLYAGAEGRSEILKLTIANGADLKSVNRYGGTALIPAAHHGHVEAVRILLGTSIDKDHVNNLGWTALLEAVILGNGSPAYTEIVRLLVEAGADVNIADRDGVTPLAHARRRDYAGMVQVLMNPRRSSRD